MIAPPTPDPLPPRLLDFLRQVGVALSQSGEATNRVGATLERIAAAYGADGIRFFVLPTGVFVRVTTPNGSDVDFAPADNRQLGLDQIDRLYSLVDDASAARVTPGEGVERLHALLTEPPRYGPAVILCGHTILTVGLGLLAQPTWSALIGYVVLGAFVGTLYWLAGRFATLSLALPITAAALATIVAMEFGPELTGVSSAKLLIPPLVTFLPGAALTIGTIELATGSMVAGASRLVSGFNVLGLLAFGIYVGVQVTAPTPNTVSSAPSMGWWAPLAGVALTGLGYALRYYAPPSTVPWLVAVLGLVWTAQFLGTLAAGALFGAFAGGLVLTPIAYLVQSRPKAPAAQVSFLPAFWMLVPGAIGLSGLSRLVITGVGLNELVTAVLTVIAIALGVLVGSSVAPTTTRHLTAMAELPARLRRHARASSGKAPK